MTLLIKMAETRDLRVLCPKSFCSFRGQTRAEFRDISVTSTLVHENAQIALNQWMGHGFATLGTNFCGMIISGGYNGGYHSLTELIPFTLTSKERRRNGI